MTDSILEADGANGTVRLYDDYIEIEEHRLLEPARTGTKTNRIPLDELGNVEYTSPGRIRPGKIVLAPSGIEHKDITTNTRRYEITFLPSNEAFPRLRDELTERR